MAKTARDIMTPDCRCVGENESVLDAARQLAELGVGAMPICGEDNRLKGMLTDRDIVVKIVAQGKVRRLPVIDGHELVGVVSQGDVARNLDEGKVGDLVEAISS